MRGEHTFYLIAATSCIGSSPHARGAPYHAETPETVLGIIPACAGSTPHRAPHDTTIQDHPRMRGEHERVAVPRVRGPGSSPHARGALVTLDHRNDELGIIPACAGSTRSGPACPWSCRDHPRMRGEHDHTDTSRYGMPGSSPHARGARVPWGL